MRCPVCGSERVMRRFAVSDRLFRMTTGTYDLVLCESCSVEFLWPRPAPREIASFYPEEYWVGGLATAGRETLFRRASEAYRRWALRDHVRFVRRAVGEQRWLGTWRGLLDVGAGDGSFLTACGVRPSVGVDVSAAAARKIVERGLPAICARSEAVPMADGSFSLITMFHVLEHLSEPETCLGELRRLLSPEGRLILQVPNTDSWQCRILGARWSGYDPPRHLINYSARGLAAMLARNGFAIERASFFCVRDNPTTLANSLAPSLFPPARLAHSQDAEGRSVFWSSLAYLGLVMAAWPLTLIESAAKRGASVIVQARSESGI